MKKHNSVFALAVIASTTWLAFGSVSFADEVTTMTTHKTAPDVVVAPPPIGAVVGTDAGCSTKQVTKTDGDTGDTVDKTKTNCD